MPHIPKKPMAEPDLLGFEAAKNAPSGDSYDTRKWLYVPPFYAEYRYVLGTAGSKPLLCVGLNPSTAGPDKLDNTLKSVERVALFNGFDSFLMMNLYAQRATRPGDMDKERCDFLHRENLRAFRFLLHHTQTVWAAWGAVMATRGYLFACVRDFGAVAEEASARWVTAGKRSMKGHPHHPLYLRGDSALEPFDLKLYLWDMQTKP